MVAAAPVGGRYEVWWCVRWRERDAGARVGGTTGCAAARAGGNTVPARRFRLHPSPAFLSQSSRLALQTLTRQKGKAPESMPVAAPTQLKLDEYPSWGSRGVDCFQKLEHISEGCVRASVHGEGYGNEVSRSRRSAWTASALFFMMSLALKEIVTSLGPERD